MHRKNMLNHWPPKNGNALLPGLFCLAICLSGCRTRPGIYDEVARNEAYNLTTNAIPDEAFSAEKPVSEKGYADPETVRAFSEQSNQTYHLGPGDVFDFFVRGRSDISVKTVTVSPDGKIALPRVGIMDITGQSIVEITETITERLRRFYEEPEVTLVMKTFNNNKVYVLGRVANPGAIHFDGRGNLLEALSLAGGLPVDQTRSWLSRCMIVRGKDTIIWINLQDLLDNGNMILNAQLYNGDVIYIPQSLDQVAYIMGEVNAPGMLQLNSQMTLLDAIMSCGGPTDDSLKSKIYLARAKNQKQGLVEEIDLKEMYRKGDLRKNYILQDGDIVYVSEKAIAKFNYFLRKVSPSLTFINLGRETASSLELMESVDTE